MRPARLLLLLLVVVAWPAASRAEKVKTNQSTKLYSRAGFESRIHFAEILHA